MKNRVMNIFIGIIIGIIITGATFAASNINISAIIARDINIKYNGELQEFKDAKGTVIYPVMVNGSTYLPVRAVAGLVDLPVNWDGKTRTVILGTPEGPDKISLFDVKHNKSVTNNFVIRDDELLEANGQTFKNGMNYRMWNSSGSFIGQEDVINFDTRGYEKLSFTVHPIGDYGKVEVVGDKDGTLTTFKVEEDAIVTKTVSVSGNNKVWIYVNTRLGERGVECRIYEPVFIKGEGKGEAAPAKHEASPAGTGAISLFDVNHTKNLENNFIIRDEELLTAKGSEGNQTFKNGMNYKMWNSSGSFTSQDDVINFDTKGYNELTFTVHPIGDYGKVEVVGDKDGTLTTFKVEDGSILTKKINISGNDKIWIYVNTRLGERGVECRIYEPVINK